MGDDQDFSLLPAHIVAQIMKHLKFDDLMSAMMTCSSWYYASCNPAMAKYFRVNFTHNFDGYEYVHRPFGTLNLTKVNFDDSNCEHFWLNSGRFIREIVFEKCLLSLNQLFECLLHLIHLTSLKIIGNENIFTSTTIGKDSNNQDQVIQNMSRVQNFTIDLNSSDYTGLEHVLSKLPNLKMLNLNILYSNDSQHQYKYQAFLEPMNEWNEINLIELRIRQLSMLNTGQFFRDFSLITKPLTIHRLELVAIDHTYHDLYFTSFCKKLSNLRILSVQLVGANQIADIAQYMTQLEELQLCGEASVLGQTVQCIGNLRYLKKLHLNFYGCNRIREDDVSRMFVQNLNSLTDLHLSFPITHNVLVIIGDVCTNLVGLELLHLKTRNLDPIFKNLVQLRRLKIFFRFCDDAPCYTDDVDVTNLELLEILEISHFAHGLNMNLIRLLPNLKQSCVWIDHVNV